MNNEPKIIIYIFIFVAFIYGTAKREGISFKGKAKKTEIVKSKSLQNENRRN